MNAVRYWQTKEFHRRESESISESPPTDRKKLGLYDNALASDAPEAVRCMDYSAEWTHFRSVLGEIKNA